MEQDRIWEYFQNEGLNDHAFPEARQRFMLKYLKPGPGRAQHRRG